MTHLCAGVVGNSNFSEISKRTLVTPMAISFDCCFPIESQSLIERFSVLEKKSSERDASYYLMKKKKSMFSPGENKNTIKDIIK